ncbi:DUF3606 domain-containing protein [Cupriavidus basilensis]|uniref:DUF3606 domain-containing protein n=1 Tax=Cupriavidus basilensis TaxID=68895 RepID=A0ABT6AHP0_9BURK|nr:DUF3606 domain-containing protein [Cupriavidus basilensis]MDF3832126.1 DUF3606 domain-containing protein [Cupriavidus basilensis]
MSIDLKRFKPLDPGRVNTMDAIDVQYWCADLNCTQAELEDAVSKAGDHISAVRAHLEASHPDRRHG